MPPKISVVIPAYNAEMTIRKALDSVLRQTIKPLEIVVVDDGSADGTVLAVQKYGSGVKLLRQANQGAGAARNHGVEAALGDWIAFLDADDEWLPGKLERQLLAITDRDATLVHTAVAGRPVPPTELDFQELWRRNWIATSSVAVRKDRFCAVGGFPIDLAPVEDYYVWLKLAFRYGGILACSEPLTIYSPTDQSVTRNTDRFVRSLLECLERVGTETGLTREQIKVQKLNTYAGHARGLIHLRQRKAAQMWLAEATRLGYSFQCWLLRALSYLPDWVFNAYRALKRAGQFGSDRGRKAGGDHSIT
ncbi:MAG: glycosyltransferase family 2 protein [Acidobacteria bacterium]|nr:glycosyltransferase family 2 protein [Acidobacteriota bacterium]